MSLDLLPDCLLGRCVKRGGLFFFRPIDAINVVEFFEKIKCPILGVDAFLIGCNSTQPLMEHSVEYSEEDGTSWLRYKEFLRKYIDSSIFFEIIV